MYGNQFKLPTDGFHDTQQRMTVNVLQREVDQMRIRVNANGMRVRQVEFAFVN